MKIQAQANEEMQALGERLKDQRTVMVTLTDAQSLLGARPMTALEMDSQGALWFMVSHRSMAALPPPTDEAGRAVNVAFSDEGRSLFVSLAGTARLVDDMARKAELWSAMARPWFHGADDPDLALLCVQPLHIDVWDGPDSSTVRALAMATSVAAGRAIGLGERESIDPPARLPSAG